MYIVVCFRHGELQKPVYFEDRPAAERFADRQSDVCYCEVLKVDRCIASFGNPAHNKPPG